MRSRYFKTGHSAFFALAMAAAAFGEAPVKYSEVEFDLTAVSREQLGILGLPLEHHEEEGGRLRMPVSQFDLAELKKEGIPFHLLVDDFARHLEAKLRADALRAPTEAHAAGAPENFKLGGMGGYLTFAEIVAELDLMRSKFPNLISAKFEIGKSRENRSIWAVRISNSPNAEQQRPKVWYDGLAHAREPMSMMNLTYFMWHLLENYATDVNVKRLLDNLEIVIAPCVNPDGYEYNRGTNPTGGGLWRKNRSTNPDGSRGVDLNRNFSTFWGNNTGSSGTGSSDTYRGREAFSEPEAKALRDYRLPRKFFISMNHHAYANRGLTPYGVGGWPTNRPDYERIGRELTRLNGWQFGPTPVMLGYSVAGGIKDWGHEEAKEYGWGAELGASSDGFWPIRSRIEPLAASILDLNLAVARQALPAVVRIAAERPVSPDFSAGISAAGRRMVFHYHLSDPARSWHLHVRDSRGRELARHRLSPTASAMEIPTHATGSGLTFFEVLSCGGDGCRSEFRQKLAGL